MKKTKVTDKQIAFALRQAGTGTRVAKVCRKMVISEATFYNWKKKFGGMGSPRPALKWPGEYGRDQPVSFGEKMVEPV